jgi:hypothetical protein
MDLTCYVYLLIPSYSTMTIMQSELKTATTCCVITFVVYDFAYTDIILLL